MLMLTQELFGAQDPDTSRAAAGSSEADYLQALNAVVQDFYQYFQAISDERRARPREDLATLIANAKIDGQPIGGIDELSYYVIVATAGHDTTSSSTAGAVWKMCEDPGLLRRLKADPSLIPGLVDEAIRWTTPVKHFMRSATADAEVGGVTIRKGDWLMLCYASGNRDEAVFEDPEAFRPERKPNRHLAFGYGAHLCLGQHLAKLEMRIFFEELIANLEEIAFDGEPRNTQSLFVNGPKSLPVRFRTAARA
jgi:cytochrome P450